MKKTLTTLALASALVLTTAAFAGNGPRGDMNGPSMLLNERVIERLALTDDQQDRIGELIAVHRSQHQQGERKTVAKQEREAMDALMAEPEFDEAAARALLSAGTERRLEGIKLQHELAQVLTSEQREQLEKMRKRHKGKRRQDGDRRDERRNSNDE
ncbi:Spy/CpxP family protein refolding chaperone [Gilvimarinus polysaccharolyticus]|uniref:Spy/CpxP family protein refolding chaperone n=1 Tax=Gilvimarinus polysaccharolyticus TaxID=863921 RepID=UPI00067341D0|nr:Spy/CpxP family protein refolding chaperone [Gilvimarinus polysaccharolyticus]